MSDELKACPFCGTKGAENIFGAVVLCAGCSAETQPSDWNRRTVTREQVIAAARALHTADANDGLLVMPIDDANDASFYRRAAVSVFRAAGFEVADG